MSEIKIIYNTYMEVRDYVVRAQNQICKAVNNSMVETYWNIGKKYMRNVAKMTVLSMEKITGLFI